MRAAVTHAPRSMALRDDVPEPGPPGAGEVVVRPEAVGICGSDFHFFAGELHEAVGATLPRVQGHEVAATIDAVGPGCATRCAPASGSPSGRSRPAATATRAASAAATSATASASSASTPTAASRSA